jgi:hypothetical protein
MSKPEKSIPFLGACSRPHRNTRFYRDKMIMASVAAKMAAALQPEAGRARIAFQARVCPFERG